MLMKESTVQRTGLILLLVSILALTFSPPLQAEEKTEEKTTAPLSDKLMIRGGWAYVFGAHANVAVGGPVLGVGTSIDFTQTLGRETNTHAFPNDNPYRVNRRPPPPYPLLPV